MKIVIPVLSLHRGGGCRVVTQLANGLAKYGHDVEIIILRGEPIYWPVNAKVTRVKAIVKSVFPKADVIIPNYFPTVLPAYQSKRGKILRLSNGYEPLWAANKKIAELTYRIPVPVLSISDSLRQLIKKRIGRDSLVARPGIDPAVFRPYPKHTTEKKRIFFINRGSEYKHKGSMDFWGAMWIVKQFVPNIEVHVVTTEKTPVETNFPYFLHHAKSDMKMAKLYAKSDLFVVTSWFESLSLPVLEAMACGTAVVTTASGGINDFAVDGSNCLITPIKNPELLAKAVIRVLTNDELRAKLVQEGLKTASQWTWERFYSEVNVAVRRCIKGNYPL